VGYGKTAITLGLISSAKSANGAPPDLPKDLTEKLFKTEATLVIVPSHLMSQWPKEIKKFMGSKLKVVELKTMQCFNKCNLEDLQNADIVVVCFTVLSSPKYFSRLSRFTGVGSGLPSGKTSMRHFDSVYKECLKGIGDRVISLKSNESSTVFDDIEEDAKRVNENNTDVRLDGKKSVYKNETEESTKVNKAQSKKKSMEVKMEKSEVDPWGLRSAAVKKSHAAMKCPPLEMMFWNRIVIDEFHVSSPCVLPQKIFRLSNVPCQLFSHVVPHRKSGSRASSHPGQRSAFTFSMVLVWNATSSAF
jgi:hypothetical protein